MAEGILLPSIERGTLLPEADRLARLRQAMPLIEATVDGERDAVALQATLACLLWETLPHANWCGFYRRVGPTMLAVGPYQGTMGCLRIDFSRGVCGACARTLKTQIVADVHEFPGHIACDDRSRSEIVVPVLRGGELIAVLDIDSPHVNAFRAEDATLLEGLVTKVFDHADLRV